MKIILFIKKVLLLALALPVVASAESITYTATYDYSYLTIENDTLAGETYAIVSYEGLHNGWIPGTPSLPVDYIKFSVPYNATNFSVSTTTIASGTNDIGHAPYPCQAPVPIDSIGFCAITLPDSSIYYSGEYYPPLNENAWVVDEGFLAGENHIVTVAVMPISYRLSAAHELLRKSIQVHLTLSYDLSSSIPFSPILTVNPQARNEGQQLTQSMVVNPSRVSAFAPPQSLTAPLNNNSLYPGPAVTSGLPSFPYLIITTPELSHSLRRIVALKRQKGYNVKVATVNEIMSDPYAQYGDVVEINGVPSVTFDDNAGVIRQYLKLARYYNNTKYLLLAGTSVPFRKKMSFIESVPTDLYYSDLNSNWRNDTIDKYPELFVGRILAKTSEQIDNYTNKLFRYELNPGAGDFSYLSRALYTESYDMKNHSKSFGEWMNFFCPDSTIIQENYGQKYPTASDVIDSINTNKYGFWSTYNHGEPSCISTYGVGYAHVRRLWAIDSIHFSRSSYSPLESDRGLNNMFNKQYPMISYSISCITMPYDIYHEAYQDLPMNFGESFTTGKDYGGPAYLGNTRDGYKWASYDLAINFGRFMYRGYFKIGEAEALSKTEFYNRDLYDYIPMVHNLLGEPEFEMWTDSPQSYSNIEISRTNNSVSITGINADSTIVAYFANDGRIGTDTISTTSVTLNDVSPNSTIMLYKHNHIPYIAPMSLQNITLNNSQYVIASDVIAGSDIDNIRTSGDVVVTNGIEYEIEASGKVSLEDGFKVEKGAKFAVYPSCF